MGYTSEEVAAAFVQVDGHLLELHARWKLFRKLYRGNKDSAPILRSVAGEMFWVLGRLLHRGTLLLFRQLTDGPKSAGKRNASLEGVLEAFAGRQYATTEPKLMALLARARASKQIRDHVNKYIAHLDFDLLSGAGSPPGSIELAEFEAALEAMRDFANGCGAKFLNRPPRHHDKEAELMTRQAEALVQALRKGTGK